VTGRTICLACGGDYAARADGTPRKHPCHGTPVGDIALPWTTAPLTQNQLRRMHPLREAAFKRTMLAEVRWTIRAAKPEPLIYADVTLHWRMPDRRRRDGDGAAPTLKICLDALVHEGVLPEDSWVHVRHSGVTTHPPIKGMPGGMWLEVRPVKEGDDAA
jgi:crossover junction endodeoxyribonuclease RusA